MTKLKLMLTVATVALLLGFYLAYSNNQLQQSQLLDYQDHLARLQNELESHAAEQVAYETEINQLRRSASEQQAEIASLQDELNVARQQINPDIEQLEREIRQRVQVEVETQYLPRNSRLNLIKELSNLDPVEMGQLMSLQGRYGGFLQSLNVDDDRLEVISDALINQMNTINQRRQEIFQARSGGNRTDAIALRQEMQELNSPAAQREALAYLFTDEEMALFESFQENQRTQSSFAVSSRALPLVGGNAEIITVEETSRSGTFFIDGNTINQSVDDGGNLRLIVPSTPENPN